jgi:hypothetical protein
MRGGRRNGAGRPKGTRSVETMVKDARRNGMDEQRCPSLAYLRKIVTNKIKNPNQQKIEAAKALLAYEAPRWGERAPEPEARTEEEILEDLKGLASNAGILDLFLNAAMGSREGQDSILQCLTKLGFTVRAPEMPKHEGIAEVVQLRPASA